MSLLTFVMATFYGNLATAMNSFECFPEKVHGYIRENCLTTNAMVIYKCLDTNGKSLQFN